MSTDNSQYDEAIENLEGAESDFECLLVTREVFSDGDSKYSLQFNPGEREAHISLYNLLAVAVTFTLENTVGTELDDVISQLKEFVAIQQSGDEVAESDP
jgi:hypothetical protein